MSDTAGETSVLAHDNCARVESMRLPMSTWAAAPKCPTCDALDAIWQRGYDTGKAHGKAMGRYDAQQERNERLTTAARVVLLLVIMAFLIDVINHRTAAEAVAE